jgi:isopenicillin N synthase-like dioxygenase
MFVVSSFRRTHYALAPFLDTSSSLQQKHQVAFEIDKACREVGFFYLKNHGVPSDLVAGMLAKTRQVFETSTPRERSV